MLKNCYTRSNFNQKDFEAKGLNYLTFETLGTKYLLWPGIHWRNGSCSSSLYHFTSEAELLSCKYCLLSLLPICFSSSSLWRNEQRSLTGSGEEILIWRGPVSPKWVRQLWSREIWRELTESLYITRYAHLTDSKVFFCKSKHPGDFRSFEKKSHLLSGKIESER